MPEFIRVQSDPAATIIELELPEYLDSSEFDHLNQSLLKLLDGTKGKSWIIDLEKVSYLGSAMLGMMVNFRQRVNSTKGRLVLCNVSPRLAEIIRTCCMDRLFPMAKTRADALKLAR